VSNFLKFDDDLIGRNINLGLDLQGGSYLLLEIDNKPVVIQKLQLKLVQIKDFLKEKKIKFKNISIKDNNKIYFEITTNDIENVSKLFTDESSEINPYFDQFKSHQFITEIDNNTVNISFSKYGLIQLKSSSQEQAIEIVRNRVDEVGTNEPNILKRGVDRILVELPGLKDPKRIKNLLGKTANLTFQFVTNSNDTSYGTEVFPSAEETADITVSKRIILSGDNLADAQPRMDSENNETVVSFTLDRIGAKKFARATTTGVGKDLAIILDGKVISAPTIQEPITGGAGQITGGFTFQSATDLALLLRSGALPAPMEIIEERTVGPDLGQDSINAGIFSLIIGFLLVIIFMIYKYRFFGIVANIALFANLFILVGILTIFEATLTLPGIAGIILTVGMAVDANVLIFERIKEELKNESNKIIAFDSGYSKSKTTILDANITTLIAAIILFIMGSGPVKGFSVTLGVGILTTLFSVYFIARLITSIYINKNKHKEKLL
tara:strand:+ start:438 stop:1925 length:1488 start_codon:yes stop_codon:yes gene_type:complete